MRAVQITAYGGPEVMVVNQVPEPEAGPGQLRVAVAATGVNPVDWKIRDGHMKDFLQVPFPFTLGNEFAGTVTALGEGVSGFAVGDAVYGSVGPIGVFADVLAVRADAVAKAPTSLSMVEAAALPVAVVTAQAAFDAEPITPGTRLLVHAAAGGVGSIVVQLAKALGAEVTALTSPATMNFVRGLGADHVIDRTTAYEQAVGDFDIVLDAFGPPAQARSWGLLKPGGILISLVAPPDQDEAARHGVRATMTFGAPHGAALRNAAALADAGKLKPTIQRTYPVEEAVAAMAEVESGTVRGKIVLTY
ncbi:NADPH:quinone reductase-like Zn-dependent oxidoreductase [Sphingobium fontiphilum]|uniref:NADPH:quinone reductase-like Zn-dependent oxidoreductase n=1 Tax=Sphingobium fontiphilum TaxID=944425 RepID=A0A7W6DLB3_9SPHN|nr:NADP-dependent oxidoreductase [Sphingobium fontiphilum]MBB3982725.1 NADPH:quinone reductase-like Zn-dependent oxidoreductase [Sphingobium fontiphilum]